MKINQESSEFSQWDAAMTHFCTLFHNSSLLFLISVIHWYILFVITYTSSFMHFYCCLCWRTILRPWMILWKTINILNVFFRAVKIVIKINSAIKDKIKTELFDHWIEYDHPLTYVIFCFFSLYIFSNIAMFQRILETWA